MRNGHQTSKHQHHRMRGRNRGGGKSHNPLTRVYESNGPDVKIRGTANHIAEKYIQLARDAAGSGDPVAAENYYQHAEHYFRLIAAAQEQVRQNQPFHQQRGEAGEMRADDSFDDGEETAQPFGEPHSPRDYAQSPQPYPREQPQPRQESRQEARQEARQESRQEAREPRQPSLEAEGGAISGLPSFITGAQPQAGNGQQNGHDGAQGDRFPLHRRRRRGHRGPRADVAAGAAQSETPDDASPE